MRPAPGVHAPGHEHVGGVDPGHAVPGDLSRKPRPGLAHPVLEDGRGRQGAAVEVVTARDEPPALPDVHRGRVLPTDVQLPVGLPALGGRGVGVARGRVETSADDRPPVDVGPGDVAAGEAVPPVVALHGAGDGRPVDDGLDESGIRPWADRVGAADHE